MNNLHSTIVVLKCRLAALFSPIRAYLHSTIVVLKYLYTLVLLNLAHDLHSTIVVLKYEEEERSAIPRKDAKFTFYYSRIKIGVH